MSHPLYHSMSSVKKHGGCVEDYLPIHNWFDESKKFIADFRHRALRHHAEGIFACEKEFGVTITNSDGKLVPVRIIGEQHVMEDCGRIPPFADWVMSIQPEPWMNKPQKLSREFDSVGHFPSTVGEFLGKHKPSAPSDDGCPGTWQPQDMR